MVGSEVSEVFARRMPVTESEENDDVPPLMRASYVTNPAWEPNLGNSGYVKEQCRPADQVHNADLANQVKNIRHTETAILEGPVKARQESKAAPRYEENETGLVVFVAEKFRRRLKY